MLKMVTLFGNVIVLLIIAIVETEGKLCTGSSCPAQHQQRPPDGGGGEHIPPADRRLPPSASRRLKPSATKVPRPTPRPHETRKPEKNMLSVTKQAKPTPHGTRRPKPTPVLVIGNDKPMPLKNSTEKEKIEFYGSFYKQLLQIQRIMRMRFNDSIENTRNKTSFQKNNETQLSEIFRNFFKKIKNAEMQLKPSKPPTLGVCIPENVKRDFEAFKKMFTRKLRDKLSPWHKLIRPENIDMKNGTEYRRFIKENLKNVSRIFRNILNWWLERRPKPAKQMKWRPCEKDCQKIERMVTFCKRQMHECETKNEDVASRGMLASVRRSKPQEKHPGCGEGKKRCALQFQCVPAERPCIDDRDIFHDGEMDYEHNRPFSRAPDDRRAIQGRPSAILGEQHYRAASRTPRLKPSMALHDVVDAKLREFLRQNGGRLNSAVREKILPTAVLQAMRDARPSVIAGLISTMKDRHDIDLRRYIYPSKSSNRDGDQMRPSCSLMCPGKNTSFCWAEMRCVKRGMRCGIKHLMSMMNATENRNPQECHKDEFFCPVFMQCKKARSDCSLERFLKSCPLGNETCGPLNDTRRLGSQERDEEDRVFQLKCPEGQKYCPESSGCARRNESCLNEKRFFLPAVIKVSDEKRIFCRLRDVICPRVHKYWQAMRPGCRERASLKPNRTDSNPGGGGQKTMKHGHFTVRPTASRPHGKAIKPHTRIQSRQHKSVMASRMINPPIIQQGSLPTIVINPKEPLSDQIQARFEIIAVAALNRNAPVHWKCSLHAGGRRGNRDEGSERNVQFPSTNNQGKMVTGLLLPTRCSLSFQPTSRNFHGAFVLKYTHVSRNQNSNPFSVKQISPDAHVGNLVALVYPVLPQVNLALIGKDHIEIIANKDPQSFQIRDVMALSNFSIPYRSSIPEHLSLLIGQAALNEYKRRLEEMKNTAFKIAVVGYEDKNPGRQGSWSLKTSQNPWRSFPPRVTGNPILLSPDDRIKFTPNLNFHGKVRLMFAVAKITKKKVFNRHLNRFEEKAEITTGRHEIEFGVNVKGPPILSSVDTCLPPLPFELTPSTNVHFQVSKIISDGRRSCSGSERRNGRPLVSYSDGITAGDVGIAIVQVSNDKIGHWEYKSKNGTFQRIQLLSRSNNKGYQSALCLRHTSKIRYVPKNFSEIWSTAYAFENVFLKFKLMSQTKDSQAGPCNITTDSMLFSKKQAQLSLPRRGCDGEPGLMEVKYDCRKCRGASGRCEERPVSPVRQCEMRDCAQRCYQNGSLSKNILDSCGGCQMRKYFIDPIDCNGDCSRRKKACVNKCGICVNGRTNRSLDHGMNACGVCSSSVKCSKKITLISDPEVEINEEFEISIKAEGFLSLNSMTCSLYGPNGPSPETNLRKVKAWRPVIKQIKHMASSNSCVEATESWHIAEYERVTLTAAGEYKIKCSVDNERILYDIGNRKLKAISTSSVITGFNPSFVEVGKAETVIVKGSGFQNTSGLSFYIMQENSTPKLRVKATFISESSVSFRLPKFNKPGKLLVNILSSSAVRPSAISRSGPRLDVICSYPKAVQGSFKNGLRTIQITLDKPATYSPVKGKKRFDCETFFKRETASKLNNARCTLSGSRVYVFLPFNSKFLEGRNTSEIKIWFNRENLRCKWVQHSRQIGPMTQMVSLTMPNIDIKAVIMGEHTVDLCSKIVLSGSKSKFGAGGKRKYRWTCFEGNSIILRSEGRPLVHIEGSKLKPNTEYDCKLCIEDILGNEDCAHHKVRSAGNASNSIHVRIPGSKHRRVSASQKTVIKPAISFIQCGQRRRGSLEMNFIWQVLPSDGVKIERTDKRNLIIKPGNLIPQRNYTLNLLVRAVEDQVKTAQASVKLEVLGVPLQAKIRGGEEMTVGCYDRISLDGSQSRDPALTNEAPAYFWECFNEDGRPCVKSSKQDERLILKENKRVYLNVDGNLECNQSYTFSLTFSKGPRSALASIRVKTKPGKPAEVKVDQRRHKKIVILEGYIKTKSSAVINWNCHDGEGYDTLNFDDKSLVKYRERRRIKIRNNRKNAVIRERLIVYVGELAPNTKHKIKLEVQNADSISVASTVVKSLSAPKKGDLNVFPLSGTAMNTSFSLSADEGWEDEDNDFEYEIGFLEKSSSGLKESVLKQYSDKNFIDAIELPPGDPANNFTLKVYAKVKNNQGLWTMSTTEIQVKKLTFMKKEKVKETLDSSNRAIAEQNYEKANQMLKTVLKTAKSTGVEAFFDEGKSMKDELTEPTLKILKSTDRTNTKMTFSTLELTTEPGKNGTGLKLENRNRVAKATKNAVVEIPLTVNQAVVRRKRRSAENTQSNTVFTPKSKEEVDSVMIIFDNVIHENETDSQQDDMKASFTSSTSSLLRSLCAGLVETGAFSISKNNLSTLRASRAAGETFNINSLNLSDFSNGPVTLKLGTYLQQKYEQWNCSDNGLPCTELCVGSVLYHHDLYKGNHSGRIADIANIHLIHPDNYNIVDPGKLQSSIELNMKLNETPDQKYKVECRTWNSTHWTTENCVTHYSGNGFALCNCTSISNITVFKNPVQVKATELLSTEVSSTTDENITATPATGKQSSSFRQASMLPKVKDGSTWSSSSQPTLISTTKSATTTTGKSTQSTLPRPTELPSIQVVFSFPVDYSTYAGNGKAGLLKQEIINMLSTTLKISKNRIQNLEIKPGSIIVSFTLIEASPNSNEVNITATKDQLEKMVSDGSLKITLNDGTVLTADPKSLKFGSSTTPSPKDPTEKEPSRKPIFLIVTVSVLVIILLAFVAARFYIVHKSRRTKIEPDRPQSAKVLIVDAIELEEKKKMAELVDEFEESNKSTENLVTVGIGSSAHLKTSPITDC